jgi:hypothetical protein
MLQREATENRLPRLLADVSAEISIDKQHGQRAGKLLNIPGLDQPSVGAVPHYLLNTLPPASYGDLARRHRFEVDTSQSFIAAGEHEKRAIAHKARKLSPGHAPHEADTLAYLQFLRKRGQVPTLRAIADKVYHDVRVCRRDCRNCPQ